MRAQRDPRFKALFTMQGDLGGEGQDPRASIIGGRSLTSAGRGSLARIWRETSQNRFSGCPPNGGPSTDLDALSKSEHAQLVLEGANAATREQRCIVSLSDGARFGELCANST